MEAFALEKSKAAETMKFAPDRIENIEGKGENAGVMNILHEDGRIVIVSQNKVEMS